MKKGFSPYLIGIIILLGVVLYHLVTDQLTFLALSNHLFLISLPFVIIGGFLWVFSSGFFDLFQRSFHTARTRNRKKKQEWMPLSAVGSGHFAFWLIIAAILFATAILFFALYSLV